MKRLVLTSLIALAGLAGLAAGPALAVDNGGPIDQAMGAGKVGEQADGYLGFVRPPAAEEADLRRRVQEVNIRRRAVYADVSRQSGESVDRVALLQAFRQIGKAPAGEWFRDVSGRWCAKGPGSDVRQAADDTIIIACGP